MYSGSMVHANAEEGLVAEHPGRYGVTPPQEIAPGVHYAEVGKGIQRSNVFFTGTGSSWSLVDTGSAGCAPSITRAAESLFGHGRPPEAVFLTHHHPDHTGSVRELAELWECPFWVHPDELPLTRGELPTVRRYANPLDRWIILPLLRLYGSRRAEEVVARSSLEDVVRALDPTAQLPGLPGWEPIPTPGHTPGHVAFFRGDDKVLLTGDALVTVLLNSWRGLLPGRQDISRPPWYTTWDWEVAKRSVGVLADLEPRVLAGGHGRPLVGADTAARVRALADS